MATQSKSEYSSLDAANEFVKLVADDSSILYSEGMIEVCPIDITVAPIITMIYADESGGKRGRGFVAFLIVFFIIVGICSGAAYVKRVPLREFTLQKLAVWKYHDLRDEAEGKHGMGFDAPRSDGVTVNEDGTEMVTMKKIETNEAETSLVNKSKVLQIEL